MNLLQKSKQVSTDFQEKRESDNCQKVNTYDFQTGKVFHYACGLDVYDYLDENEKIQEQHKKHHKAHKQLNMDKSYLISISGRTGEPYCRGGCNNGWDIVDKLTDAWYNKCDLETENILECGLDLSRCKGVTEQTIIDGHNRHHQENHLISIRVQDMREEIYYFFLSDGKCSGYCAGEDKSIRAMDYQKLIYFNCGLYENTGVLAKMECGLIFPSRLKSEDMEKLVLMHKRHHDEMHENNTRLLNPMYKCVCKVARSTQKRRKRKMVLE